MEFIWLSSSESVKSDSDSLSESLYEPNLNSSEDSTDFFLLVLGLRDTAYFFGSIIYDFLLPIYSSSNIIFSKIFI